MQETSPVHEVKKERVSRSEARTPAFELEDMARLFRSFDTESPVCQRDRALIAVMAYTFARVMAAVGLNNPLGQPSHLRLDEKGGKLLGIPCPHQLEEHLDVYIEAAGIAGQKDAPLFRSAA